MAQPVEWDTWDEQPIPTPLVEQRVPIAYQTDRSLDTPENVQELRSMRKSLDDDVFHARGTNTWRAHSSSLPPEVSRPTRLAESLMYIDLADPLMQPASLSAQSKMLPTDAMKPWEILLDWHETISCLLFTLKLLDFHDIYWCLCRCLHYMAGSKRPLRLSDGTMTIIQSEWEHDPSMKAIRSLLGSTNGDILMHNWLRVYAIDWLWFMKMDVNTFHNAFLKWAPQINGLNRWKGLAIDALVKWSTSLYAQQTDPQLQALWMYDLIVSLTIHYPPGTSILDHLSPSPNICLSAYWKTRPQLMRYMLRDLRMPSWQANALLETHALVPPVEKTIFSEASVDAVRYAAAAQTHAVHDSVRNTSTSSLLAARLPWEWKLGFSTNDADVPSPDIFRDIDTIWVDVAFPLPLTVAWRSEMMKWISVTQLLRKDKDAAPNLLIALLWHHASTLDIHDNNDITRSFRNQVAVSLPVCVILGAMDNRNCPTVSLFCLRALLLANLMANYVNGFTDEIHCLWDLSRSSFQLVRSLVNGLDVQTSTVPWVQQAKSFFRAWYFHRQTTNDDGVFEHFEQNAPFLFHMRRRWLAFLVKPAAQRTTGPKSPLEQVLSDMATKVAAWKEEAGQKQTQ